MVNTVSELYMDIVLTTSLNTIYYDFITKYSSNMQKQHCIFRSYKQIVKNTEKFADKSKKLTNLQILQNLLVVHLHN